jgi:hypothetical protein
VSGKTPGQAAYDAFIRALKPGITNTLESPEGWDAAANAAIAAAEADGRTVPLAKFGETVAEVQSLRAERDAARDLVGRLERITTTWTRGMYCAWIDCRRGDAQAAARCLSEGLDGYDGERWNGTETGAEWWERTKAEEGL